jgi:hypothetical protein
VPYKHPLCAMRPAILLVQHLVFVRVGTLVVGQGGGRVGYRVGCRVVQRVAAVRASA